MKKIALLLIISFLYINYTSAQNTVGLLSYDIAQSYQGYTLIYPHNQPNIYLLNNCGEVVHTWEDEENFRPGNTVYLRDDGSIVKTKRDASVIDDEIWAGGGGAIVEIRSWENDLLWSFELNDENARLHHDIALIPNGNILMLAWEKKSNEEAIAQGRRPDLLNQEVLWPDYVFEVNPNTDEIVWEWHAWDHLIQDYDETKANYGVVSEHPELIDINWDTNEGKSDWMHSNALDFRPELNQIMISVPTFHEIWIIDHSTTTEQSAGHVGGNSNHGGDLLYRAGNQQAYQMGDSTDQILFYQHDAHWSNEFIPNTHPFFDHVVCFNNRVGEDFSSIEIFETSWNMYLTDYQPFQGTFPPYEFQNTITHPTPTDFHSTGLSSAQLLPNGNVLSCSGRQGYIVELTPNNDLVWEYVVPFMQGQPVEQGTVLELNDNLTFRAFRYPMNYSAFDGKDLTATSFLELNPNEEYCDELVATSTPPIFNVSLYPNPSSDFVHLSWNTGKIINIKITDTMGRTRVETTGNGGMKYLDISMLEPNVYFITVDDMGTRKILVH